MAVDWRSESIVELVTCEVKLNFTARLVQQAHNYARFSHRVWIAARVEGDPYTAANEMRSQDTRLFDYAVDQGLGILACRPARGRSYEVFPIHWPRRLTPESSELEAFMERYRAYLEPAQVLEPAVAFRRPRAI